MSCGVREVSGGSLLGTDRVCSAIGRDKGSVGVWRRSITAVKSQLEEALDDGMEMMVGLMLSDAVLWPRWLDMRLLRSFDRGHSHRKKR